MAQGLNIKAVEQSILARIDSKSAETQQLVNDQATLTAAAVNQNVNTQTTEIDSKLAEITTVSGDISTDVQAVNTHTTGAKDELLGHISTEKTALQQALETLINNAPKGGIKVQRGTWYGSVKGGGDGGSVNIEPVDLTKSYVISNVRLGHQSVLGSTTNFSVSYAADVTLYGSSVRFYVPPLLDSTSSNRQLGQVVVQWQVITYE